jgi:hypothetical protein
MATVETNDAQKDRTLAEVSAKTTPECVPLAGFVVDTADLQQPVPYCNHNAP